MLVFCLVTIKTFPVQSGCLSVSLVSLEMLPTPFSRSASQVLICMVQQMLYCIVQSRTLDSIPLYNYTPTARHSTLLSAVKCSAKHRLLHRTIVLQFTPTEDCTTQHCAMQPCVSTTTGAALHTKEITGVSIVSASNPD